jgi:hypothetical protein
VRASPPRSSDQLRQPLEGQLVFGQEATHRSGVQPGSELDPGAAGYEYDNRWVGKAGQQLSHPEPVQIGKQHIQQHQIGPQQCRLVHCLSATSGQPDHLITTSHQQTSGQVPEPCMIVHDEDTQRHNPDGRTSETPREYQPGKFMDFRDAPALPAAGVKLR